jgi:hypothetical protein
MNISGPIESITISGRRFAVEGEDAGNVVLSGFKNEIKFNGDGSKRIIRSRASGSIKNLNVQVSPIATKTLNTCGTSKARPISLMSQLLIVMEPFIQGPCNS